MCQHFSTSFCAVTLVGNHAPNHQLCMNHSECERLVLGGDPHPGCICKTGYTGDHCEVQSDAFGVQSSSRGSANDARDTMSKTMFGIMIVVILVVTSSIVYLVAKNRRIDKSSWRENYNPESSLPASSELTVNNTTTKTTSSLRKTEVGEGDLDPDGSGTMMIEIGSPGATTEDDVSVNSETDKSNGVTTTTRKEIV